MRIETVVYIRGTSPYNEDGLVINQPLSIFGVTDGFSAPWNPNKGAYLFPGDLSGGEMVSRTIEAAFLQARPEDLLSDIILRANKKVGEIQTRAGFSLDDAGQLAAASFVFARIKRQKVEIIQGGDSLAVWLFNDGRAGATKNLAYPHVSGNLDIIAGLMEKYGNDKGKMWEKFGPALSQYRTEDINNPSSEDCFALINGQAQLEKYWQTIEIPTDQLKCLLLFSDGLVNYQSTADEKSLTQILEVDYKYFSILDIIQKRKFEKSTEKASYTGQDETTAIMLTF